MNLLNKFLHDSFYRQTILVFLVKVVSSIVGFSTTIILVKQLGGQTSSDYFFLVSLSSFLTAISTFGCPDAILKFVAINQSKGKLIKTVVFSACALTSVFSLLVVLTLYIGNMWHEVSANSDFITSIFILLPLTSLSLVLSSALQGRGNVVLAMITSGVLQNVVLLTALMLFANSYLDSVIAFSVGHAIACLVATYYFLERLNSENEEFDKVAFRATCSSMFVTQCIVQYNNNAAILLLGFLWVGNDLSIIAVSLKLTTLLSFIIISVNKVLAPKIASTYKNGDMQDLQKLITKSSRLMWALCLPAVFILMLLSKEILGLIDESYREQSVILVILTFGQLVNVITGNIGLLLSMTGHEKVQRNILLTSLAMSLCLGFILIPEFGPLGAAIMASATVVLVNLSSYMYVLFKLKINTFKLL
ncbi:oligosaccharide flippase family protein [Vibrio parahaemolyticus]|nr:oligosaccharide flippase family protein [Vibrio parahaemolyticus]